MLHGESEITSDEEKEIVGEFFHKVTKLEKGSIREEQDDRNFQKDVKVRECHIKRGSERDSFNKRGVE